jgi:hypothetical protein
LQVGGIGTALKILFSYDKGEEDSISLRRAELIALVNAFGRVLESIRAVELFHRMKPTRDNGIVMILHTQFKRVLNEPAIVFSLICCLITLWLFVLRKPTKRLLIK